jgi:hypothetical protein
MRHITRAERSRHALKSDSSRRKSLSLRLSRPKPQETV